MIAQDMSETSAIHHVYKDGEFRTLGYTHQKIEDITPEYYYIACPLNIHAGIAHHVPPWECNYSLHTYKGSYETLQWMPHLREQSMYNLNQRWKSIYSPIHAPQGVQDASNYQQNRVTSTHRDIPACKNLINYLHRILIYVQCHNTVSYTHLTLPTIYSV